MNGGSGRGVHRVTAIFHDAALSFDLARDATLAKLAEQLSILGERHGGPLMVNVRLAAEMHRAIKVGDDQETMKRSILRCRKSQRPPSFTISSS
jgi:hypothetical protein